MLALRFIDTRGLPPALKGLGSNLRPILSMSSLSQRALVDEGRRARTTPDTCPNLDFGAHTYCQA